MLEWWVLLRSATPKLTRVRREGNVNRCRQGIGEAAFPKPESFGRSHGGLQDTAAIACGRSHDRRGAPAWDHCDRVTFILKAVAGSRDLDDGAGVGADDVRR